MVFLYLDAGEKSAVEMHLPKLNYHVALVAQNMGQKEFLMYFL